jgi:hypothetical protein
VIIPTPEFDPLFADDGVPFRTKMCEFIAREFADILGADAESLETGLCRGANGRQLAPQNPILADHLDVSGFATPEVLY